MSKASASAKDVSPHPDQRKTGFLRSAAGILALYWRSDERWTAVAIFATAIILIVLKVYTSLRLNDAGGRFFNSLQSQDRHAFNEAMIVIATFLLAQLVCIVLQAFASQSLEIRWRRWLTNHYTQRWLANRAFYEFRFREGVDNPDQRIAEDLRLITSGAMNLGMGFVTMFLTVIAFAGVLWDVSGSLSLPLGSVSFSVPGYMFWAALLYWIVGAGIGYLLGRPLIFLDNRHQGLEADFRFALIRVRENAEGIALYGGEDQELRRSNENFGSIFLNYLRIIRMNAKFLSLQTFLAGGPDILPFLAVAPRYFSGALVMGDMMRIGNGFGQISRSLSWLVTSFPQFAEWRATIDRLNEFDRELDGLKIAPKSLRSIPSQDGSVSLENLTVFLPNGSTLLDRFTLRLAEGQSTLLRGISGSGKSTLFRVLAGLWPFGEGLYSRPQNKNILFLPQQPYIPIGPLRAALWFPAAPREDADNLLREVLASVGLDHLSSRLSDEAHWEQVLSPGEQQRLALCQAMIQCPDWLFLDEATSALDEEQEEAVYRSLFTRLSKTTVVSIGHRKAIGRFHDRVITLQGLAETATKLDQSPA